jgi:UDPglucose 6-dehydrogenase
MWGVAYKENTNSIKNSPAVETMKTLSRCTVQAHDPSVKPEQLSLANVQWAASPLDALRQAEALLIMTPWNEYKGFAVNDILRHMKGNVILDPYGLLTLPEESDVPCTVHVIGKEPIHIGARHARHYA